MKSTSHAAATTAMIAELQLTISTQTQLLLIAQLDNSWFRLMVHQLVLLLTTSSLVTSLESVLISSREPMAKDLVSPPINLKEPTEKELE
jgi:hypothetical protein